MKLRAVALPALRNGMELVSYDADERRLIVFLPEGMRVSVLGVDSGLETRSKMVGGTLEVSVHRTAPRPTIEKGNGT